MEKLIVFVLAIVSSLVMMSRLTTGGGGSLSANISIATLANPCLFLQCVNKQIIIYRQDGTCYCSDPCKGAKCSIHMHPVVATVKDPETDLTIAACCTCVCNKDPSAVFNPATCASQTINVRVDKYGCYYTYCV